MLVKTGLDWGGMDITIGSSGAKRPVALPEAESVAFAPAAKTSGKPDASFVRATFETLHRPVGIDAQPLNAAVEADQTRQDAIGKMFDAAFHWPTPAFDATLAEGFKA